MDDSLVVGDYDYSGLPPEESGRRGADDGSGKPQEPFAREDALRRLAEKLPFALPDPDEVEYRSFAQVTRVPAGSGMLRKYWADKVDGLLMLAGERLLFVGIVVERKPKKSAPEQSWAVNAAEIAKLNRPKWMRGLGLTFEAGPTYYMLGFLDETASTVGAGAARLFGPGAPGVAGAEAVEGVRTLLSLRTALPEARVAGEKWFELLSQGSRANAG